MPRDDPFAKMWEDKVQDLQTKVNQYEAMRYGLAREFPNGKDDYPDTGSVHENIRKLKNYTKALEFVLLALIDKKDWTNEEWLTSNLRSQIEDLLKRSPLKKD